MENVPLTEMHRYAEIQALIKALEVERSALGATIVNWLAENSLKSIDSEGFRFTKTDRKIWDYPQSVRDLEDSLKREKRSFELNNPDQNQTISFVTAKSI
jgi:hypothetical protein